MSRLVLLALAAVQLVPAAADHPIAGVITLLEKLETETKQEAEAETATYQKFTYWCKRSTRMLTRAIKKEKKAIGELTDKLAGLDADIMTLGEDLAALAKQLEVLDKQKERAKAMRAADHELYGDDVANLDGSIGAADSAIETLEEEDSLLQVGAIHHARKEGLKAPKHAHAGPEDLLKLNPGANNPFKPKPKVFSNNDGGVIETFKGFEQGWNIDKLSEEEQETNALNAYALAKQARDTAISTAKASKSDKEGIKSDKESEQANAVTSKQEQEKMLAGDTGTLETTDGDCKTKAAEWDERTKIRNGELEAMAMAKKILAKVSGVRDPADKALLQSNSPDDADGETSESPTMKSLMMATEQVETDTSNWGTSVFGVSFLQIVQADDPRAKAVNLLRKAATQLHKKSLARLAQELSTYDGPFDKIKAMIQKMIFQLQAEQTDEDQQANWCGEEMDKSTDSQADKTDKKNIMTKKVQEMDAAIKLMIKQITENDKKVNEIVEYEDVETKLRDENHAECMATVKDSKDAQTAINEAIAVLKDFYKKSGMIPKEPWEFLQTGSQGVDLPESPATWDSSYTGTADPKNGGGGILTILDETMQKFSKMEADAKVADETDQKEYEQDMAARKIEKDEANMDTQMKSAKKDSTQQKMMATAASLKSTSGELDAVEQYLKDLDPACGGSTPADTAANFGERKKARLEEIDALRKAETILEDAFRAKAFLQHPK